MKIITVNNKQELNELTGEMLIGLMLSKQNRINIAITAGSTPKGVYSYMAPRIRNNDAFNNVHYYNFDEIPSTDSNFIGITMRDLEDMYLNPAQISTSRFHHLNGDNYKEQDEKIKSIGGLDAILLGIGKDSHYCGNLPGTTKFEDETVKVDAKGELKKKISGHFENQSLVPDYWITMGPRSIMAAKKLILIATGSEKAEAIWHLVKGPVDNQYPASVLKLHPDLTVIADKKAMKEVNK
ncbi:glucosamine-6-phosphate deaminase [Bombilactobacillus bombi]|uniref:glucosamine-6-phosphate deaminase n=1 Tax=Bombilactobacillus bombi TaxID=1303590 RepID=UPI000E5744CE|nr:glucosamine-6-phosphate deaminase [Bombilactobacillus bombi]AXX65408.1 glucosamine-6-phosphate deaminase [Bombilactobacillus bombi]